jgi:hypothetical protein
MTSYLEVVWDRGEGSMLRIMLAGLLVSAAVLQSTAQVSLNGWDVGKKDGTCVAYHAYKDREDDNAANVISFGLVKAPDGAQVMVISLFYEKWKNDGDEEADLLLDKRRILAGAKWKMHDKNTLVGTFTGAKPLIEGLSKAKQIVLQFSPKTKAVFDMPDPSQALGALQYCLMM